MKSHMPFISPRTLLAAVLACGLVAVSPAFAQTTVTTQPVGFVTLSCSAASDTFLSVPLTQPPQYVGPVTSVTGSTISFSASTPGWTASQWTLATSGTTYYALVGPNPVALAGTVATVAGTNVITGSATTFTSQVHANDTLIVNSYGVYTVTAVNSDTSLTVSVPALTSTSGLTATDSAASANPNEGRLYTITANDTQSITVNLNGDTISAVAAGTQITIIPYWTLATLFPASTSGTAFTPTTSLFSLKTELLIPNYAGTGINNSASQIYYFYNGAWRLFGDLSTNDHSNDVLQPNTYFILRNPASAAASTLTVQGNVAMQRLAVPLATLNGSKQDNEVGILRGADVNLNNTGLIQSGAFTTTTSLFSLQDQLLVFSNSTPGLNKSATSIYYYYNSAWRLFGDLNTNDHGTDVLPAGSGFIIRKASNASATTAFWQGTPNFN